MKKVVLITVGLLLLCGISTAYHVTIDAPESIIVGKPLVVTGNTTFGTGTPLDVVLYLQFSSPSEITAQGGVCPSGPVIYCGI